jgi:hypothetical protein
MRNDALRGLLQLGFFFSGLSLCSVLAQPRDSGEFVVSVCSLGIGLTILLIAGLVAFMMR